MTLTVTFDLLQGQICCRAGDHNSLNLLVIGDYFSCINEYAFFDLYSSRITRGLYIG